VGKEGERKKRRKINNEKKETRREGKNKIKIQLLEGKRINVMRRIE
jgi:hypothetical protein